MGASRRSLPGRVALMLVAVQLVVACSSSGSERSATTDRTTQPDSRPPATSRSPGGEDTPPTTELGAGALALGTYSDLGEGETCLPGASACRAFEIACPGLTATARGEFDVREATTAPQGVVIFFSHSGGGNWWLEVNQAVEELFDELQSRGLTVVQVRWRRGSWLSSARGEDAGTAHVACRPSTVVKWIHDTLYAPLGVDPGALHCGLCVVGNSGGASQATYPLAYYGLENILDAVVAVSGPPHAAQVKGCMRNPGEEDFWYDDESQLAHVDGSYGHRGGEGGPCARHDPAWVERWEAESLSTGAHDLHHPATRVHVIIGEDDQSPAPAHGRDYVDALRAAGSPHVTVEVVPDMGHGVSGDGNSRILATLLG